MCYDIRRGAVALQNYFDQFINANEVNENYFYLYINKYEYILNHIYKENKFWH